MVIIQEQIEVNQEFIDKVILKYKSMSKPLALCIGDFVGGADKIIKEITALTPTGLEILRMNYNSMKWLEKQKELEAPKI